MSALNNQLHALVFKNQINDQLFFPIKGPNFHAQESELEPPQPGTH